MLHRPLDGLRGVRPRALVMGIVVAPHESVGETHRLGQRETRRILLERGPAVLTVVLARQAPELRAHPEMGLPIRLVPPAHEPRPPADPGPHPRAPPPR